MFLTKMESKSSKTMPVTSFANFIIELKKNLAAELPGPSAHDRMAPAHRNDLIKKSKGLAMARQSSVLILLFPDLSGKISTTFIKRVEYDGVHSGQISFPGGKSEETDTDLADTALREAEEEVGIIRNRVEIIGALSDLFVPPSNFIVRPYIAQTGSQPHFTANKREVAEIFTVPLSYFADLKAIEEYTIPYRNGLNITVPGFMFNNHLIWGATAMILNELLQLKAVSGLITRD